MDGLANEQFFDPQGNAISIQEWNSARLKEAAEVYSIMPSSLRSNTEALPVPLMNASDKCKSRLLKLAKLDLRRGKMPPANNLLLLTVLSVDGEITPNMCHRGSCSQWQEFCCMLCIHLRAKPQDMKILREGTYKLFQDRDAALWVEEPLSRPPGPEEMALTTKIKKAQKPAARAPAPSPAPAPWELPNSGAGPSSGANTGISFGADGLNVGAVGHIVVAVGLGFDTAGLSFGDAGVAGADVSFNDGPYLGAGAGFDGGHYFGADGVFGANSGLDTGAGTGADAGVDAGISEEEPSETGRDTGNTVPDAPEGYLSPSMFLNFDELSDEPSDEPSSESSDEQAPFEQAPFEQAPFEQAPVAFLKKLASDDGSWVPQPLPMDVEYVNPVDLMLQPEL